MARYLGFEASKKERDYYFISYNSEDSDRVGELTTQMHDVGIDLWYDDGIPYGDKWEEIIGEKISNAKSILFFFTKGMLAKEDSYAIKEYRIANRQGKKIYIYLVDELVDELWKIYPKKSSFLDDIDQKHCPDKDIISLIKRIKDDDNLDIKVEDVKKSTRKINIEGPVVLTSEYLLNNGILTAEEISRRHVELDYLATDKSLYPGALEVEGDADTWLDMITETADCSANLIINNQIVAYMDFLPVTPGDYDLLKRESFNDSYVAFYSFGGRFDIFGSMFSFDPNYVTPNNYLLFMKWMIERIISWRENDIIIGKIEFCIYNRYQAKALENLGFKLILSNDLKGMLYEIRVIDLLNNKVVKTRFSEGRFKQYQYVSHTNKDEEIVNQCLEIATSLLIKNGGTLQYENAAKDSDVILTCELENEVVGYLALKKYDVFPNGLYIEQIAIKSEHQGLHIGKHLIEFAKEYAQKEGYNELIANCKKTNNLSHKVFIESDFKEYDMSEEDYLSIGIEKSDIHKNIALKYKL